MNAGSSGARKCREPDRPSRSPSVAAASMLNAYRSSTTTATMGHLGGRSTRPSPEMAGGLEGTSARPRLRSVPEAETLARWMAPSAASAPPATGIDDIITVPASAAIRSRFTGERVHPGPGQTCVSTSQAGRSAGKDGPRPKIGTTASVGDNRKPTQAPSGRPRSGNGISSGVHLSTTGGAEEQRGGDALDRRRSGWCRALGAEGAESCTHRRRPATGLPLGGLGFL